MRLIRKGLALFLSLLMLLTAIPASAEAPFLQHADEWLPLLSAMPVEAVITADVISCMPYDEDRVAMLRQVTDELTMRLRVAGEEGSVTILVGATEALTMSTRGNEAQLSCLPEMTFTASDDPMGRLLGDSTEVSAPFGLSAEAETLLEDGWTLLLALEEPLAPYGNRKNVKTNITDMGLARTCTDYTIPAGKVDLLLPMLLENCPEGWLKEILSGLTFSGKQTLRVYRDENGIPLRMEYNGTCGPEGNLLTVKLVWRMRRDDVAHRDELTLTSPAKTGTNKNNLEFSRVLKKNKQGAWELEGSFTYTVVFNRETTTRKGTFSLVNASTDTADVVTGEVTLQQKLPGQDDFAGFRFAPEMTLSAADGVPAVSGSVTVSTLRGKDVLDSAVLHIDLHPFAGVIWQEREETIDMDLLSPAEMAALQADVTYGTAAALVRPLIMLLGDTADWFFRDMLPEQIQRITDAANTVVIQ